MSGEYRPCGEFDRLMGEEERGLAALEVHAESCPDCAEELRLHLQIQLTAPQLRRSWPSPDLWARIETSLATESPARKARTGAVRLLALAAALALITMAAGVLVRRGSNGRGMSPSDPEARLLTERALEGVERAEEAYVRSIDALSRVAEPRLRGAESPLLMNYKEKLDLLDSAIAECRAQIDANRFHAGLRRELLLVYRSKEQTLEDVLKENRNGES